MITGPSGVGKGTVVQRILKSLDNLYLSISATTREKRSGEEEGVSYFFKSKDEFQKMIDSDQFIEWAEFAGNFYGTPKYEINKWLSCGKDVLLEIEVQGAKQILKKFPDAITVFLKPPNFEALEERLIKRNTESLEKVKIRLKKAKGEMQEIPVFTYEVLNDDLEEAVKNVISIIRAERCKVSKDKNNRS